MLHIIKEPTPTIQIKDASIYGKDCTVELTLSRQTILGLADLITQLPVLAAQMRSMQSEEVAEQQQREYTRHRREKVLRGLALLSRCRKSRRRIEDMPDGNIEAYWAEQMRGAVRKRYQSRRNTAIRREAKNSTAGAIAAKWGLSQSYVHQILKTNQQGATIQ